MDNFDEVLKEKTIHANRSEFYVFLPNDLNISKSDTRSSENKVFRDAIAAKNAGNFTFQEKKYDAAINNYNEAIEMFEGMDRKVCNLELAVCYQNRAAAKEYKKNYNGSILDATKAIELNDHYSKAYFRRGKAFFEQRKYYCALQDVVQASILERFKNKTYNKMVGNLLARIDVNLLAKQWELAYEETDAAELYCDHCMKNQILFIKKLGIFDGPISVPIPKSQPATGYILAMTGMIELDPEKILAGCKEEESVNGPHLAQSYIVRAYMNTVVLMSPSCFNKEYQKDLRRLNQVISDDKIPENIKFHAQLCRANIHFRRSQFKDANRELDSLDDRYKKSSLFHVIKSGALFQLAQENEEFIKALDKCCEILPNVYELHMQRVFAESKYFSTQIVRTASRLTKLSELMKKFPNELEPRMCLAGMYAKMGETHKAKKILKKAEKDFPNCLDKMSCVYGMLRPEHSSCVAYFKRSLKFNKDDPGSLKGLLDYFGSTTYEYAKAIEVANKALYSYLQVPDFQLMFEYRHALLKRIVRQDYWEQL